MENLLKKILIKWKEHKYKKYIEEHRENVRRAYTELVMCPNLDWLITPEICEKLLNRVKEHDLSKYSDEEFDSYRRYYYPINRKEKQNAQSDFDKAWEHHWKNNDHHWQNRQDWTNFSIVTQLAILENILDWIAMGYKFNDTALRYYLKNKDQIILPEKDREFLEKVLYDLDKGPRRDWKQYGIV